MLQLENRTPFEPAIAVLPDRHGVDTLFVVVKATLTLRPTLALAGEQVPPVLADEYHGDPASSSLRAASELHIGKPGTDVLLTGQAWTPDARPATCARVTMTVADRQKTLLVTGDRTWRDGRPSPPQEFVSMPMQWERAYGGSHTRGDRVFAEEHNPVGRGFTAGRSDRDLEGLPLPNIEDPTCPVTRTGGRSVAACLAPVAPSWLPRRQYAGTYDETWQRSRAPYLPDDFDPRFLQAAAPEFAFDRYLTGGEQIEVTGVAPDGPIAFVVPSNPLDMSVLVAGATERPPAHLETLVIEPDANRVLFTWRAALPCDRTVLKVEKVIVARARRSGPS